MNKEFFLSNLWRWKCGLPEIEIKERKLKLEDLKETEWSPGFEKLMRNRLIMGALRYGRLRAPCKLQYDRTASIIKRMKQYRLTGNKELLVDVANLCLCEFEECNHPLAHFRATDDKEHTERINQ